MLMPTLNGTTWWARLSACPASLSKTGQALIYDDVACHKLTLNGLATVRAELIILLCSSATCSPKVEHGPLPCLWGITLAVKISSSRCNLMALKGNLRRCWGPAVRCTF